MSDVALRPWREADAAELAALYLEERGEIELTDPWREPSFFSAAGQRGRVRQALVEAAQGRQFHWAVLDGGAIVGTVGLEGIERGGRPAARLGYWIARRHRRRGIGSAAVCRAADAAFGELGLHRLEALVLPENAASRRLLERLGFGRDGSLRVVAHGLGREHLVYRCLAEAWDRRERPGRDCPG